MDERREKVDADSASVRIDNEPRLTIRNGSAAFLFDTFGRAIYYRRLAGRGISASMYSVLVVNFITKMPKIIKNKPVVEMDRLKTYLSLIKNSVGTKMFRNYYASVDAKNLDITRGGEISCAFYASSVLTLAGLLDGVKVTVHRTISAMEKAGWHKVAKPKAGDVIIWGETIFLGGDVHKHLGFYVGGNKAVSNSSVKKIPVQHHWTFGARNGKPVRAIIAIYRHPSFEAK
jgi:hypothetical protein